MTTLQGKTTTGPRFVGVVLALVCLGLGLEYPNYRVAFDQAQVYFEGPDDYMRVYRARQVGGDTLRVRSTPEINSPAGAELHWTAPMDYLLAGAGGAFGWFVWRADPFGAVAAMTPLVLGVIYLLYMARVLWRGFGAGPALLATALIVLSPSWHRVFRVGHPDHHCLLALLLLLAVGPWIPRTGPDGSPGQPRSAAAICSGLAIGLAIWVSIEAMVFWLAVVIATWAACTFGPLGERRAYARARLAWNLSAFGTMTVAWLFENWPDVGGVAADKISLLHVMVLAIGLLVPIRAIAGETRPADETDKTAGASSPSREQSRLNRHIAFLAAVAAFTTWLSFAHERAFEHVSRPEFPRWIGHLMEFQPLCTRAGSMWSLQPLHGLTGYVPYVLPVLLVFFLRRWQTPRAAKYALVILAPTITLLAIKQLRWIDHFNVAVTPVVVIGAWQLGEEVFHRLQHAKIGNPADAAPRKLRPASAVFCAALLVGLVLPAAKTVLTYGVEEARQAAVYLRRTDFVAQRIIAHKGQHGDRDADRQAILCEDGEGPALLYWTGLPVVATPYHRALDGLLEMARFFAERDPAAARERLDRLGVRYVVMPPRAHEQLMQFEELAFGELRSFDPPEGSIDDFGREILKLNYRPAEVRQTMAYRLVMESETEVIPGVERIAEINEGAKTLDGQPIKTGLLYVVHDLPPTSQPEAPAREHSAE